MEVADDSKRMRVEMVDDTATSRVPTDAAYKEAFAAQKTNPTVLSHPSSSSSSSSSSSTSSAHEHIFQNTTDYATASVAPLPPTIYPMPDSDVSFRVFVNDNTDESNEALIALKNIFSKQLPKMPKDYIVRLVLDHRHVSMGIMRQGRIIGGLCYRPYHEQRFGEIAFCAISGTEQVKGYGTMLMNYVKHHVQRHGIEYFLTYADNYAIGYFRKQGFSKVVSMPKERWVGFIKDYDGGTLMECYIHPNMNYLDVPGVVAQQRAFIYSRITERSHSSVLQPPLDFFKQGKRVHSLIEVSGVLEAGWNERHIFRGTTERDRNMAQSKLTTALKLIVDKIRLSPHVLAANLLGNTTIAFKADAADIMNTAPAMLDLSIIQARQRLGDYYRCKETMHTDLLQMTASSKASHGQGTSGYAAAEQLEKLIDDLFPVEIVKSSNKESTSP